MWGTDSQALASRYDFVYCNWPNYCYLLITSLGNGWIRLLPLPKSTQKLKERTRIQAIQPDFTVDPPPLYDHRTCVCMCVCSASGESPLPRAYPGVGLFIYENTTQAQLAGTQPWEPAVELTTRERERERERGARGARKREREIEREQSREPQWSGWVMLLPPGHPERLMRVIAATRGKTEWQHRLPGKSLG